MDELRYIAPTGMVGAGFQEVSLAAGAARRPAFIGCDAGSTDAGPFQLGSGEGIFSRESCKRDLALCLRTSRGLGIPLLVGSCGGAGTDKGVDLFTELIAEIAHEHSLSFRLALVYAEPDRQWLRQRLRDGRVHPLIGAPPIDEHTIDQAAHVVAMMGAEPFAHEVEQGADVVLAGRSSDTSIFSAIPEQRGFDPGLVWHAAKIMECGSAAAAIRNGQDCMLCILDEDHFVVEPLNPDFVCTPGSVAAHSLYENADPFRLVEPAGTLDTSDASYTAVDDRRVRVSVSRFVPAPQYTVKLEAAELAGYQSITMGGVRDPVILRQLDDWLLSMRRSVEARIEASVGLTGDQYVLGIRAYGRDGTLG
ncbi:MAG: acyclic terpene utilization AtuA family protein, partial [Mycobacteriales bacterium]